MTEVQSGSAVSNCGLAREGSRKKTDMAETVVNPAKNLQCWERWYDWRERTVGPRVWKARRVPIDFATCNKKEPLHSI
jgi:hypothetical protein